MADIVCIGAHPDDVEIGMGGTVAGLVRRGLSVAIVDLTDGEPTPHGTHETRLVEASRAADVLGVERITLNLPNRYLFDSVEARTALAEVLRELRPRTLFVPYPEDAHPDHIAASRIAVAARFYSKFTKTEMRGEPHFPARVYHYMAVHMSVVRSPSFIVDISEDLPTKIKALDQYESQFALNPSNSGVVAMMREAARMWGGVGRIESGEPFFSLEPVALKRPEDLL